MPGFDDLRPLQSLRELFDEDVEEVRKKLEKFAESLDKLAGQLPKAKPRPPGPPDPPSVQAPPVQRPPQPPGQPPQMGRGQALMQLMGIQPRGPNPQTQQAFAAFGTQIGGMATKVAGAASVIGAFVEAGKQAIDTLKAMREEQLRAAEHLRQFSGVINQQQALLEKQQVELSFRTARATQGTAAQLLQSERDKNEAWQRWNEFQENMENVFATGLNRMSELVGTAASEISEILVKILQWLQILDSDEDRQEQQRQFNSILQDILQGKWDRPRNQDR